MRRRVAELNLERKPPPTLAYLQRKPYATASAEIKQPYRRDTIQQGGVTMGKAFVPLAFELGEAFQFDWSEEGLVIGGIYRRLQVAHMKLCARVRSG
jgi:hypothetical protein